MSDIWDDDDHAIARALGADAPPSGQPVDDAVGNYEEVLSYLPFEEVAPAEDLEDRVVRAALARRPAAARVIDTRRNDSGRARGRASWRWVAAGATAVAAAAVVVVLLVGRPASGPSYGARIEPNAATGDLARVLAEPGTRRAPLADLGGDTGGRVVLDPFGQGYLTGLRPPASNTTTQWLWLDTTSGAVRVGPLGRAATVHFVVHGHPDAVLGIIVTAEPNGTTPKVAAPLVWRATFAPA